MDSIFLAASLKVQGVFIGHHEDYNRNHDRESPLMGAYFFGGAYAGEIEHNP